MIVNQITEPPFYLVGVFIHNLYVSPRCFRRRSAQSCAYSMINGAWSENFSSL